MTDFPDIEEARACLLYSAKTLNYVRRSAYTPADLKPFEAQSSVKESIEILLAAANDSDIERRQYALKAMKDVADTNTPIGTRIQTLLIQIKSGFKEKTRERPWLFREPGLL